MTATTVTDDGSFPLAAVRDTSIIIAALTLIALYLLFGNLCFNWSLNFMLFVMAKIVITYLGAILASLPIIYWISKRGLVKQPDSTKRDFHAS